jgi:4-hydroxy-tetrahydrodipicolinate synthase
MHHAAHESEAGARGQERRIGGEPLPHPQLRGLFVAVVTPFHDDASVDFRALERHLDWLVEQGVHGVMVAGTAGEYASLSDPERKEIALQSVRAVGGRGPVIVHTGHSNREPMLALTRHAEEAGADAVMLVPPSIVKPTQGEIEAYFREAASAVSIGVVVYNNPTRVGVGIGVDTLLRISEVPNIVALKDSGRNLAEIIQVIDQAGDRLAVLSGETDLFLPTLALGGRGGILTMANFAPGLHVELFESFGRGELQEARSLHRKLIELSGVLSAEGKYHAAVKAAMRLMGMPVGVPRRPLSNVSAESETRIRAQLERFGLLPASLDR